MGIDRNILGVNIETEQTRALAKKIKEFYDLKFVEIVPCHRDAGVLKKMLGLKAAVLFERLVSERKSPSISVGGGGTLYEMAVALPEKPRPIRVYPAALIGRGPEIEFIDSSFIATLIFLKSRPISRGFTVGVPPLPNSTKKAKKFYYDLIVDIPEIEMVLSFSRNADMIFIGAGGLLPIGDMESEMSKLDVSLNALKQRGAIGGINYNWFDESGKQLCDLFLNVRISELQSLVKSGNSIIVLVAGGAHKYSSILCAIKYKMINSLVVDQDTAEKIIKSLN